MDKHDAIHLIRLAAANEFQVLALQWEALEQDTLQQLQKHADPIEIYRAQGELRFLRKVRTLFEDAKSLVNSEYP